jgi:GxxExxY protein
MAWSGVSPVSEEVDRVAHQIIGCAITVHRLLGPGFREHIYQQALCLELNDQGLRFEREKIISITYKQWQIPGHRVDLIVEESVLVELKAVPRIAKLHKQQLVSYLKAANLRLGLLINFDVSVLRDGLKRFVL